MFQGWHLLQVSALFGYFAFATNQNNRKQREAFLRNAAV